jgi:hypothetical protein
MSSRKSLTKCGFSPEVGWSGERRSIRRLIVFT